MIKLQISSRNYEIDEDLNKYIQVKLGRLDKYLPKAHKPIGMTVEIFRDPSGKEDNRYRCSAILEVPGPDIAAETATMNPHSAVDIVEAKLRQQISRYKQKHSPRRLQSLKHMLSREA